ncbi:ABC transporter ATP-binding protein [Chloroflexota bacterium]
MNSANQTETIIEIKDVEKVYQVGDNQVPVLKGLSTTVDRGEFIAITGPSGNGKSTLLNMITGIDRPTAGQVMVNGYPVHDKNENQLAKWRGENLGIIFQFFQLLPSLSLQQNVVMPMEFARKYNRKERRERAMDLLEMVGLADQAYKLPGMVSGGQQQRAAIARALANDPPLLIADEPTGNLDSKTAESVFDLFLRLVEDGKTLIMVTHDVNLVDRIPRIVEIRDGIIACDSIAAPEIFTGTPVALETVSVER